MAEKQVREIRVVIDSKGAPGLKEMANGFKSLNNSVKETTSVVSSFRNAFFALKGLSFAGIGVGELVQAADAMQKLTDRLTLSEGSFTKARETLGKLNLIAKDTRSSIEDISQVYARLNLSLADTGISTDALLGVTQALQNSFRLSGSTAAEATAATIQLSQGLASGQLRGQELRSVLEQNALIGGVLAKQLGITRGELLKFAEKNGGIKAADFLAALSDNFEDINTRARSLGTTVREGLDVALNDLKISAGDLNKEFGITQKLVSAIFFTARNLKELAIGVTALGTAWFYYSKGAAVAALATKGLLAIFASPIIGLIVKLGIAAVGLVASLNPVTLAIGAVVGAIGLAVIASDKLRNSVGGAIKSFLDMVGSGTQVKSMSQQYHESLDKAREAADKLKVSQQVLVYQTPEIVKGFQDTIKTMKEGTPQTNAFGDALKKFSEELKGKASLIFNYKYELGKLNEQFLKDKNVEKYSRGLKLIEIKKLDQEFADAEITLDKYNKQLQEIKFGKPRKSLDEFRLDLRALNAEFYSGKINLGQYSDEIEHANLDKLTRDMKTGRSNVLEFTTAFNAKKINEFRRALYEGNITLNEFRKETQGVAVQELNNQFQSGKMDIHEYNKALVETSDMFRPGSSLFVGIDNYIKSAGTLSQNIASVVTSTFNNLENAMVEFTKNGKFNFRDFANAVLEDLNRIIIRSLIIRPLAQGILGAITPGAGGGGGGTSTAGATDAAGSYDNVAARGAAFDGMKSNFYAAGGVVNGRRGFSFGSGRKGVMGEAGPEAILPLTRTRGGDLGVATSGSGSNVEINIINNSDTNVEQTERQGPNGDRVLDVFITNKVKQAFANGSLDRQMTQNYGLRRKGQ
jgi:lambda family phage tail tape measure protein